MEHHFLPADPVDNPVKVPYVAIEYDSGPFLTYPARKGFPWPLSYSPDDSLDDVMKSMPAMSTPDQETFYQTWLLFGLLQLFLVDNYNSENFKKVEGEKTYVTTAKLLDKMREAWVKHVEQSSKDKTAQYGRVLLCLRLIPRVLRTCNDDFDWRIKLSIASVCELYASVVEGAFRGQGANIPVSIQPPADLGLWLFEDARRVRMLAAGWCPNDIAISVQRFSSIQTLYFLSRMKKLDSQRDHEGCRNELCKWSQIQKEDYKTLHVEPTCHCKHFTMKPEDLKRCLSKKCLPLLKVKDIGNDLHQVQVQVVEYSGKEQYVAISHVWAYGMGNPSANSLPECQIKRLGELISTLRSTAAEIEDQKHKENASTVKDSLQSDPKPNLNSGCREVYLWIDTLCCPVSPPDLKTISIEILQETYNKANYVLVIDGGLTACDSGHVGDVEVTARIFLSSWQQRLWTLQEGVLARDRLWFQFKDRPINLQQLFPTIKKQASTSMDIRLFPFLKDIGAQLELISMMNLQDKAIELKLHDNIRIGLYLDLLDRSLQFRSVTVDTDEGLCISNLLRLPPDAMAAIPEYTRMSQVWRLIDKHYGGVPQRVLCLRFPRLETKGFRWAPRTLLREEPSVANTIHDFTRTGMWRDTVLGKVTEAGFLIKWPGFALKLKELHDLPVRNPWTALPRSEEFLIYFKDENGTRFQFCQRRYTVKRPVRQPEGTFPLHEHIERGGCHLILASQPLTLKPPNQPDQHGPLGLLGYVTGSTDNGQTLNFEIAEQVFVIPVSKTDNLILDTAEKIAYQLRKEPLTIRLAAMDADKQSEEYRDVLDQLRERLTEVCTEEVRDKPLKEALVKFSKADPMEALRVFVRVWFYQDIEAVTLSTEQQWIVD